MPSSYLANIPAVMDVILTRNPKSILDIGCGWGKYGFLIREYLDQWQREIRIDAVECFREYLDRSPAHKIYDRIYQGVFPDVEIPGRFDLTLMTDVLEHFDQEAGAEAVRHALGFSDAVLVCTPLGYEQGAEFGNELEVHRSEWSKGALRSLGHQVEFFEPAMTDSVLAVLS